MPSLHLLTISCYLGDIFSSKASENNPLTGSVFLLEHCTHPEPAPFYDHDETGIVLKGMPRLHCELGDGSQKLRID